MFLRILGAAILLAAAFTPTLSAQETRGIIVGRVTDATGAVAPGAEVHTWRSAF